VFRHAPWAAAILFAAAVRPATQTNRRPPLPDAAMVSITGNIHGSIPPAVCSRPGDDGIAVQAFEETSGRDDSSRVGASGSFELEMETACVAPFFQALFAHERLSTRVTFTGSTLHAPSSITLEDAQLTHVDLRLVSVAGRSRPRVAVGFSAPHVLSTDTSGMIVQTGSAERRRARAFRASAQTSVRATAADAWMQHGVDAALHLAAAETAADETSHIRRFHLSVSMPSSRSNAADPRIVLDSVVAVDAAQNKPRSERLGRDTPLRQAILMVNGQDGTTGITIWLKGAQPAHTDARGKRRAGATLAITAASLTITDISSGRTASTP